MARNEEGEFELVLGNKQLLSVFFIVAILLAVFFAMGYIVGGSGGKRLETAADPAARPPERSSSPQTPLRSPEPAPEPAKPAASSAPPEAEESGQTFLQLAATGRPDAEIMVDVLKKKGFAAKLAEVPDKPGTFRVLVGPIKEGAVNQTRIDLQNAGFPGNAAIKRTL